MQTEATRDGNLDARGQDQRLRGGVVLGAVSLLLGVLMLKLGAPTALRTVLVIPWTMSASMLFMGLYGT